MLDTLKTYIRSKTHYYLIGVYTLQEQITYELLEIALESDELQVVNRDFFTDIEKASKSILKKSHPILLHFDGDNVISRKVEKNQGYRNSIVFKMNPDDFYFYEYHQDNKVFISLSRKTIIDETIANFNANDKHVVEISIGPFVLTQLQNILENRNELYSSFHQLNFNSNGIENFTKAIENSHYIRIQEESFSQKETGLLATFLHYKKANDSIIFDTLLLSQNREEQKYKVWFKNMIGITIIFFILLLFIGHHILNSYVKDLAEKESKYSMAQQIVLQVNQLKEEQILKDKILKNSGVIEANYMIKYFAEIGNAIPDDITITEINIAPPQKRIKPNEKININRDVIYLKGESFNDNNFNILVKRLGDINWVKKVDINYTEDRLKNSFTITINK